jgi:hypothetical protein
MKLRPDFIDKVAVVLLLVAFACYLSEVTSWPF